ncbi:MAG: T9SS type A sorting domain-containing protein, partial [Cytophagaceae bacterium]|nr:T9SS type A sorting domain-containing protein [Cytophagaceae bacterium]MDW8457455.1 T9SS type A sorting domain-containing protein [Cytophagaceae bacterium]
YSNILVINGSIHSVNVFPNPFSKYFIVEIENLSEQTITIELFDVYGKKLYSEDFSLQSGKNQINISSSFLTNGNYFLKVRNDLQQSYYKITKNE